jgi:NAD(P)-dependent dehydrogenase (short-subunit alcohol dehydrogenase family)
VAERLAGKIAFVTGAASGIGAATAQLFAQEGAHVVLADVNEADAKTLADSLMREGWSAEARRVDVANPDVFTRALETAARDHGRIDILVNCAFRMVAGALDILSTEDWRRCFEVSLHGTFFGVRAAAGIMKRQRQGSIVNISSVVGQRGQASMAGYAASKAAVDNLTRTAAIEFAPHGVRVNAVAPGATATLGTLSAMPVGSPEHAALTAMMPAGRLLEPIEIARAVLFLASDDASGVNGHVLTVDGGQTSMLGTPTLDEGWDR